MFVGAETLSVSARVRDATADESRWAVFADVESPIEGAPKAKVTDGIKTIHSDEHLTRRRGYCTPQVNLSRVRGSRETLLKFMRTIRLI
jgi:hypothetical protein